MFAGNDYIEYARSFVNRIRSKGIDIRIAAVFGSYARNQQNQDSDIDVLLVSDRFVGVGFRDFSLIAEELIAYDMIQARTYSVEDYEEGDPFLDEIHKTSIKIN
jgi:uncharacterized protein